MLRQRVFLAGTVTTLCEEDVAWCRTEAERRTSSNLEAGTVNQQYSTADRSVGELGGVLGEYAACLMLGLDPKQTLDTSLRQCSVLTDKQDIPRYGGIDVKTVRGLGYSLLVTEHKRANPPVHYALFAVIDCPTPQTLPTTPTMRLRFEGAILSEKLMRPENLTQKWGRTFYEAPFDSLSALVLTL